MGQAKINARSFLTAHPLCCFCGGNEPATTVDHQPARALFDRKEWPEGYAFPACYECNQASALHENVLALLVRINASPETDETRRHEVQKYLRTMRNNFPDLLKILSTPEKRRFLKEEGLSRPANTTFIDLPMVGVESDLAQTAIDLVMKKLMRALHYKHTGQIVPAGAGTHVQWYTNAYEHLMGGMKEIVASLGGNPILRRNNRDLSDQFFYRYGLDNSVNLSAYAFFFRASIAAVGLLAFNPETLARLDDHSS